MTFAGIKTAHEMAREKTCQIQFRQAGVQREVTLVESKNNTHYRYWYLTYIFSLSPMLNNIPKVFRNTMFNILTSMYNCRNWIYYCYIPRGCLPLIVVATLTIIYVVMVIDIHNLDSFNVQVVTWKREINFNICLFEYQSDFCISILNSWWDLAKQNKIDKKKEYTLKFKPKYICCAGVNLFSVFKKIEWVIIHIKLYSRSKKIYMY